MEINNTPSGFDSNNKKEENWLAGINPVAFLSNSFQIS
jgi:hypothetical protein